MTPEGVWLIGLVQGMLLAFPLYYVVNRIASRAVLHLRRRAHDDRGL